MAKWKALPKAGSFRMDVAQVRKLWPRLHACDAEPLPDTQELLEAWTLFHNGEFEASHVLALKLGDDGTTLANKSACSYSCHIETSDTARTKIFLDVADRALNQLKREPANPAAHYWRAYALGRYSQGISVAKGLAQGLGSTVKTALEDAILIQPKHIDAHIALGLFHAEMIHKVGAMIANMTYGVRKEKSLELLNEGLAMAPKAPGSLLDYANGLILLEGEKRQEEANRLYRQITQHQPLDSLEWLVMRKARSELEV